MDTIKKNYAEYRKFLEKFNILGFAIGLTVANAIVAFSNITIDSVIMPTIDPLINRGIKKLYTIKIGGLTIHLDQFINSLLKIIILIFMIFLLFKFGVKINLSNTIVPASTSNNNSSH